MKKAVGQLVIITMTLFMLSSCGKSDSDLVKETGENFLSALVDGDLTTAKQYVTEATSEKWGDTAEVLSDVLTPEEKATIQTLTVDVSSIKVNGDEAEAICTVAIPFFRQDITVLHFKKVNGKWLVNEPGVIVKEVLTEDTVVLDTDSIPADSTKIAVADTAKKVTPNVEKKEAAPEPAKK